MNGEHLLTLVRETLWTAVEIALPFLITSLLVGLVIAILQHATQIQELTLTFVPKILVIALLLAILFPWVLKIMSKFTRHILIDEWEKIVDLCAYVL